MQVEHSSLQSDSNNADQMRNEESYNHDSIKMPEMRRNEDANRTNQCNFYAISITSKFGIPSLAARCSANMHRTQLPRTNSNKIYILTK